MKQSIPARRAAAFALLLAAIPFAADSADAIDTSMFSLRGFGTVGAVHSSEKNADFASGFQPNGAGYTRPWSPDVDSKIGLQLDARFTDKLSGVVQIVSQHRYDGSYMPQVEWANLKYQVTPDLDVRAGRTVTLPFMVSESRLVGYGNTWIRPPQEVYGMVPVTNKDGVDATYRLRLGDVTNSLHASYGETKLKVPVWGTVDGKEYFDIANTVEYGPATLRAAYSSGRVSIHSPQLDRLVGGFTDIGNALVAIPPFAAAGAQALAIADKYRFQDAPFSVLTAGASYDRDQWLLMTEWARVKGSTALGDSKAWYATAGYRYRELTPYVTYAQLKSKTQSEPGISTAGLPPPLAAGATALNSGLTAALAAAHFSQKSVSAGVRWDFTKNAALKVQYDHIDLGPGSQGRLINPQPGFQPGGTVHVFSVAVDFVF